MNYYPSSWENVTIGESLQLINGRAFKPTEWVSSGRPIIRIQNLNNPKAAFNFYTGDLPKKFSVATGDLLFAWSGTPGTSFGAHIWKGPDAWLNQHIFKVVFSDQVFDKTFLRFAINQNLAQYIGVAHGGAGLAHITKGKFESSTIPLPPLSEQKRIVAKIEELFSELEAGEESLRVARRQLGVYRQSLLKQAFEGRLTETWRTQNPAKLESPTQLLARIQSARQSRYEQQLKEWALAVKKWSAAGEKEKRPSKPSEPPTFPPREIDEEFSTPECWAIEQIGNCPTDSLIGLVRSADEQHDGLAGFSYIKMDRVDMLGNVDIAPTVFVACEPEEVERFSLRKGDILFNTRNSVELVGKAGIVRHDPESLTVYNNNLMRLRFPDCFDPVFVGLQLCAKPFRQRMEQVKKATTSVAAVYGKDFWPLPLVVPSLPEQQEIVRVLNEQFEEIERNEREIDGALRKSAALRQSILKKAFTGRLVPQVATDKPASVLLALLRDEKTAASVTQKKRKDSASQPDAADWFSDISGSKKKPKKTHTVRRPGTTDLQAGIVALAIDRFGRRKQFLGHTNAEKFVHLADALADLQLDRQPVKDAAGPNDFKRAHEIEHRARMKGWFTVTQDGSVYRHHAGHNMPSLIAATQRELGPKFAIVENLLEQLGSLKDTKAIEIFATVFAAWNNLLLLKTAITDEAIVTEARENWHKRKLEIPRERFFNAIVWMKKKGFAPNGSGQLVSAPKS